MPEKPNISPENKQWLLALARRTLEALEPAGAEVPSEEALIPSGDVPGDVVDPRGVFVTLKRAGNLRGCIGYVMPLTPLYRGVIENAVNAARRDPRFPPVAASEVAALRIEISVMSVPERIEDVEEIEIGRDGLIVSKGAARGLLLPQVATEYDWDRETFLSHTCSKAGLPMDAWRGGGVKIEAFSAEVFSEDAGRE